MSTPTLPLHPTITLGTLIRQYPLGLVLLTGAHGEQPELVADLPVQWVHGSDMLDPTPFLTPRTVLLTTGAQFASAQTPPDTDPHPAHKAHTDQPLAHADADADDNVDDDASLAEAYVERLRAAGVTALGFGVGIIWERTPAALIAACERQGLPLFRVPYETPFIAIVQTAARMLDAQSHARDAWALESQRAIAAAALQRDGMAAAVRETAARLGRWVAVVDRTGRIIDFAPRNARHPAYAEWIRRESRELIERGARASRVRTLHDEQIHLQTLGRSGHLLGVLVTPAGATPDHAERIVTGLVASLATVQLEHRTGLGEAEVQLRSSIVQLLLAGETDLADRVAVGVLPRLPRGRVVAVRLDRVEEFGPTLTADLRSLAGSSAGLLTAPYGDGAVLICDAALAAPVRRVLVDHHAPAGVSSRGAIEELAELIDQAEIALTRATAQASSGESMGPVDFRPSMQAGLWDLLAHEPEARRRAQGLLAPVRQHDERHNDAILHSLRVWLAHHGQTSPAAAELGIHRHTLRTRMQTAESLLQRDLDEPGTRADLWAALQLV